MQSDAELRAYEKIVTNDKRQRLATFLLLISVLVAVLGSLLFMLSGQKDLVASAQKDSRIRTEESRRYITCLLILPIEKRDVSGQKYCFNKSDLPGGRRSDEFNPIVVNPDDEAIASNQAAVPDSSDVFVSVLGSSSNHTPDAPQPQQNSSQSPSVEPTSDINLLERITNTIRRIL